MTKWQISKTHDSGQPWFFKRLSAENRPILTRNWCEASHLSENDLATKAQNFANSKRRTAAILQKFLAISHRDFVLINTKFGGRMQIFTQKQATGSKLANSDNSRRRTAAIFKQVAGIVVVFMECFVLYSCL